MNNGSPHCPVTGVNIIHFILCLIFGFIFIFLCDYALHGHILLPIYRSIPGVWRNDADMAELLWFTLLTEFLIVLFTAYIFTRNYEGKGLAEGARFGIPVGLLMGTMMMAPYAWLPIPLGLAFAWFCGGLLQGIGLGLIFALVYKK